LLIEVHPNPAEAWSDGAQQVSLELFAQLMEELKPFIAAAGRVGRASSVMARILAMAPCDC